MTGFSCDVRPFETKAEIRAYLNGDTVACLICGRRLTVLAVHLRARHNISADDYRVRFGIPFGYGLAGRTFRLRAAARMRELRSKGAITGPQTGEVVPRLCASPRRPRTSVAIRNENVEKLMRVHGRITPWQSRDFEEFIRRIETGRSAAAVGTDADMPSRQTLFKQLARDPQLRTRYERVRQSLPLAVQVRMRKTGSLYRETIIRLRTSGMTWAQMSVVLDVKASTLRNAWRNLRQTPAL